MYHLPLCLVAQLPQLLHRGHPVWKACDFYTFMTSVKCTPQVHKGVQTSLRDKYIGLYAWVIVLTVHIPFIVKVCFFALDASQNIALCDYTQILSDAEYIRLPCQDVW